MHEAAGRLPASLAARCHVTGLIGPEPLDMPTLADVAISRSGTSTIAGLTAPGTVLIPLPASAAGRQRHDAATCPARAGQGRAAGAGAQGRPDAAERPADAAPGRRRAHGAAARRLAALPAGRLPHDLREGR